jgi:hypothetical protein
MGDKNKQGGWKKALPLLFFCALVVFSPEKLNHGARSVKGVTLGEEKEYHALAVPNDTLYSNYQWNLKKINAETAWQTTTGLSTTIIAVLDTGVLASHQALQGKLVQGYDAIDQDIDANPEPGVGKQFHGTFVAGIIAAATNNNMGVAGGCWNCKIMPVKVLNDITGVGTSSQISDGVHHAVDAGAKVINMSFGYMREDIDEALDPTIKDAIDYANSHNVVVVAAAGNVSSGDPSYAYNVNYPAAYEPVIAVGATDKYDNIASFSSRGVGLDVVAPGASVFSVNGSYDSGTGRFLTDSYGSASGTSFSAPHVAAEAALILSNKPALRAAEISDIIKASTNRNGAWNVDFGSGRIDLSKVFSLEDWDFSAALKYQTGPNMWNQAATKFMATGDFNWDGLDDQAAMYDYGNGNMGIWSFESSNGTFVPKLMLLTGPNMWSTASTKFVTAGDFNGDGYGDVAAMYDYGNGKIGIWSFESNGTKMTARLIYEGAYGNWNVSATRFVVAGDFNKDGYEDIAAMYDYGNGYMAIWSFESKNGKLVPRIIYQGAPGNWDVSATKFVTVGDFNNDNNPDVAAMYDYGSGKMGVWSFEDLGGILKPRVIYMGANGNWDISSTRSVISGDFNKDGIDDLAAIYSYSNGRVGTWGFHSNGTSLIPKLDYLSPEGHWLIDDIKFINAGNYSGNQDEISLFYDLRNSNIGLINEGYKR